MTALPASATASDTLADLAPPTTPMAAVPVALDLRARSAEAVRRAVEAHGWQAVDEATAALVPPVVRLADVTAPAGDGTPTVLLVGADDPAPDAAAACLRLQPTAVVAWPDEDGVLVDVVVAATSAPRRTASSAAVLRVGGAAGGVGTTTVALALAGLAAWRGQATLVASGDPVMLPPGTPGIDPSALTAPDLWSRAAAIEGVPGARAVRTISPPFEATVSDPSVATVVLDLGVADDVDVLVLRPDAAGAAALDRTAAAAVVVVGDGPVAPRALSTAVGGRRRVDLPWSHRTARAALVGRVPAALPGRAVRALLPLVPAGPSG